MGNERFTGLIAIGLVAMSVASTTQAQSANGTTTTPVSRPFVPGERLSYDVFFGAIKVGTGSMEVRGIDTVRGRPAYHTAFRLNGGIPFYKVDDTFESWFATDDLASLRFIQDQNEGTKERQHHYEIYPERRTYDDLSDQDPEQTTARSSTSFARSHSRSDARTSFSATSSPTATRSRFAWSDASA
jgi:hypothetical protein